MHFSSICFFNGIACCVNFINSIIMDKRVTIFVHSFILSYTKYSYGSFSFF